MTRPAQDWMTAREAADHLGIPLPRIRDLLQDPGPLPDWARNEPHDTAQTEVTDRPVRGESMSAIPRQSGVSDATVRSRRPGRGVHVITDPAEVADIVDAYTVRRHTIDQIAQNKGAAYATIHRIVIVAGVPRRPPGPVPSQAVHERAGTAGDSDRS